MKIYHQCVIVIEQKIIDTSKFNDGPPCGDAYKKRENKTWQYKK